MARASSLAVYVLPFAAFAGMLALQPVLPVPQWLRFVMEAVLILAVSRTALSTAPTRPAFAVLIGVAVFAVWIAPDQLIPGYRALPLFSNAVLGHPSALAPHPREPLFLLFRVLNSVVIIPILEELFWRGFLMRWLIRHDFCAIPLGSWSAESFWLVAVLFASEHGSYWDVGLLAGVIYNGWMLRTRNLWDCILAHAVTNACLAAFVISGGHWQYWL